MSLLAFVDRRGHLPTLSTLTIRNATLSIVGVMAPAFIGETSGQALTCGCRYTCARVLPRNDFLHDTPPDKAMWLLVFGRLNPGLSLAEAEARANAVIPATLIAFYGAAAIGDRRAEYLDQRLQVTDASHGASYKRSERPVFRASEGVTVSA